MQCVFVLVSDGGMQMLACTEAEGSLWFGKKKKKKADTMVTRVILQI